MAGPEPKECFVISPIGKEGTELHTQFKEVLEYFIKPAVKDSGLDLVVIRADDISGPGSFIRDILQHLRTAFIVVADLTTKNANVFYELGVRHALGPRTILIANSMDDVPSDLREYRIVLYELSHRGPASFKEQLKKFLDEIMLDPNKPDNPVLDRIPAIVESRLVALERENDALRRLLATKGVEPPADALRLDSVSGRVERITRVRRWKARLGTFSVVVPAETEGAPADLSEVPGQQGELRLYSNDKQVQGGVDELMYIAVPRRTSNLSEQLADMRVLMSECEGTRIPITFILALVGPYAPRADELMEKFRLMLDRVAFEERARFHFELWDENALTLLEKELGLLV